jgi:hypothetical protein
LSVLQFVGSECDNVIPIKITKLQNRDNESPKPFAFIGVFKNKNVNNSGCMASGVQFIREL